MLNIKQSVRFFIEILLEGMCEICYTHSHECAKGAHSHIFLRLHPDQWSSAIHLIHLTSYQPTFVYSIKGKTPKKKMSGCQGHHEKCKDWIRCSFFEHLWRLFCATFRNTYSQGRYFHEKIKKISSYFPCVSTLVDLIPNFVWPHISSLLIPYKQMSMWTNSHTHTHTHTHTHIMGTIHPSQEKRTCLTHQP